ncbi:MAG: hypothetical protein ACRDTX_21665 [Pseudonocardiaceae bacterium]
MSRALVWRCFAGSSRSPRIPSAGRCSPGFTGEARSSAGGPGVLYVRFQGEDQLISVAPQLVRLLPDEPDER